MRSLTATQLRNHLQISLDCTLPATIVFNYPTIERLGDYLLAKIEQEHLISNQERKQHDEAHMTLNLSIDAVDALSERELVSTLTGKLAQIERGLK